MRLLEEMRKKLKQTVELCGGVKSCQECPHSPHSPHTRSWIRIYVILIRSYFLSQNFLICGSYCHMSSVQNVTQMSTKLQIISLSYKLHFYRPCLDKSSIVCLHLVAELWLVSGDTHRLFIYLSHLCLGHVCPGIRS